MIFNVRDLWRKKKEMFSYFCEKSVSIQKGCLILSNEYSTKAKLSYA